MGREEGFNSVLLGRIWQVTVRHEDVGLGQMRAVSRIKLYTGVCIRAEKITENLSRLAENCYTQFVLPI